MKRKLLFIIGIIVGVLIVTLSCLFLFKPKDNYSSSENLIEDSSPIEQNNGEDNKAQDDNAVENNTITDYQPIQNNNQNSSSNSSTQNNNNSSTQNNNSSPSQNANNTISSSDEHIPNNSNNNQSENTTIPNTSENTQTVIDATLEYYCTDNFVLNNNQCIYTMSTDALSKYVCNEGTLNGSNCIIVKNIKITPNRYGVAAEKCNHLSGGMYESCLCTNSGGTYNNSTKECFKKVSVSEPAIKEYYCISGTTLNGNKCTKTYTSNALFKYNCPSGYSLVGTKCIK